MARVIKGVNDLATLRPDLAAEWHPTKNGNLTPENTAVRSNKLIWWVCPKGHAWQSSPDRRTARGTNCQYCSNRKVLVGYNDLLNTYPKLCKEWDFNKNINLNPEQFTKISQTKVWWICPKCNNSWQTRICDRTIKGSGCPKCALRIRGASRHTKELCIRGGIKDPVLLQDFDLDANFPLTPNDFTAYSNKAAYWKCHVCGYKWAAKVSNRANGRGCPLCGNRVVVKGINDLATTNPELAKEMDIEASGFGPDTVTRGSGKRAVWLCSNGHRYEATILHRSYGTKCPICNVGRQTSFAEQAVFYYVKQLYPDAINHYKADWLNRMELDIYIPSIKYAIEYDGIAWHKENKLANDQMKYKRCHDNGIKLIRLKEDDLGNYLGLDIADIQFGRKDLYEYKNLQNVIDQLMTFLNFSGFGNPIDVNVVRDQYIIEQYKYDLGEDSFGYKYPKLAQEWHPIKNGNRTPEMFKPHSDVKVWWICPDCGNEYNMRIALRTAGSGCPKCAIRKNSLRRSKAVNMMDSETGEIIKTFKSVSEAAHEMAINMSNICMVCKGQRQHAGGYRWEYKDPKSE